MKCKHCGTKISLFDFLFAFRNCYYCYYHAEQCDANVSRGEE